MKARSSQYLVAERLGGDDGDLLNDPLVGVEVESQLRVVLLDDDTSSLLHGLGSDTAHLCLLWKNKAMLFNLFINTLCTDPLYASICKLYLYN